MTAPHYQDGPVTLYAGDCLQVLRSDENGYDFELGYGTRRTFPDASIDSVVTDPPYGLDFMGKEWDDPGKMLGVIATGDETRGFYAYGGTHSRGYAGHDGRAFQLWCEQWAVECLRVLKPGGHLLAFGGSRTWHRLAAAVEDAGFEIRDSIAWLYGTGFPKSMDVSKAIDKLDAADERLERARQFQAWLAPLMSPQRVDELTGTHMGYHLTTHPTQPTVATADIFDMLRPHLPEVPDHVEELVRVRTVESQNYAARPVTGQHSGPAAANRWKGTVLGEPIKPPTERRDVAHTDEAKAWAGWGTALKPGFEPIVVGRKPLVGTVAANVVAHGTGALNIDATRVPWGAEGDQSASRKAAGYSDAAKRAMGTEVAADNATGFSGDVVGTDASAGRFPPNVLLDESQAAALDEQSGISTGRVGMVQNGSGVFALDGFSTLDELRAAAAAGARTPTGRDASATLERYERNKAAASEHPGVIDSGGASRFFPTFRYVGKASSRERPKVDDQGHPTVKPLALMEWLVRLVTPRGGVVLEPFAGSGTTVEACVRQGFECIAIERDATYMPLIEKRVRKDHAIGLDFDWED